MKIVQVFNGSVILHETRYKSITEAREHYAPYIQLVEAPDNVFPGYMYDGVNFSPPAVPEGQMLDPATGTIYIPEFNQLMKRKELYEKYDGDEMKCLRKIRMGEDLPLYEMKLTQIDNYKNAVEATQLQETYPLNPTYPPEIIWYPSEFANYLVPYVAPITEVSEEVV